MPCGLKILSADLRSQCVWTPEGLNGKETADPSSFVSLTNPHSLRNATGQEGRKGKQEILLSPHRKSRIDALFFLGPMWVFV